MLPILFKTESFTLYSYPLFIGFAWAQASSYFLSFQKKFKKNSLVFLLSLFVGVWAGAKVFFYLTLPVELKYIAHQYNFWTGGGFVFYGGLIGGILVTLLWYFLKPNSFNYSSIIPALSLGHGIGRFGCFMTGCCHGTLLQGFHIPVQLIEASFLFILYFHFKKKVKTSFPLLALEYLASYAMIRFVLEFLRGDVIRGSWGIFSPSQWISLFFLFFTGLGFLFYNKDINGQK